MNGKIMRGVDGKKGKNNINTYTLKGGERMEEIWMKEYVKEYGEWIAEVVV